MDYQLWLSGADSCESIPPVPAPRHKRKLTTSEDFKQTSSMLSGENVEANIMPPPRRRNKTKVTHESKHDSVCSEDQISSNALYENNYNYSAMYTLGSDEFQDKLDDRVETLSSNKSQVQDGLKQDKTLLKSVFNITDSHFLPDTLRSLTNFKEILENGISSSSSENSAMVVGVFLKSKHPSTKYETCDFVLKPEITNHTEIIVEQCTDDNICNDYRPSLTDQYTYDKADEHIEIDTDENCVKDIEENDSGVYLSDTKSPPHKGISLVKQTKCDTHPDHISSNRMTIALKDDTIIDETLSSNNSDNIDNKNIDNMVSENYSDVLNCFEAETVSSFHMEIASRFSLCKEEIIDDSVEKASLIDEVYVSRKCNSGLSAYLKSMLETDSSDMLSVSPCPVSAADDEHCSLDCCIDELKGEYPSIDFVDVTNPKSMTSHACTFVSSLPNNNDTSQVADSNVDLTVNINNVNMQIVNSYAPCENENLFLNGNKSVYSINNSGDISEDMEKQNIYHSKSFVNELIENHSCNDLIANNILNNEQCVITDDESSDVTISDDLGTKNYDSLPPVGCGVVSTLVAFFETVHTQEITSSHYCPDCEIGKVIGRSCSTSPENSEDVHTAKLSLSTSPGSESIYHPNDMCKHISGKADPLLKYESEFDKKSNGLEDIAEISSYKSSSPSLLELHEYSSCTVGYNNVIIKNKLHFVNESIQNNINIIISDQAWDNPQNHDTFTCLNPEKISLSANTDCTVLGEAFNCELDMLNSVDLLENSQDVINCVISKNCAYSLVRDEKETLLDNSSRLEHLNLNDNDVMPSTVNIDPLISLDENEFIEAHNDNAESYETSFLTSAISLHPHLAHTTSKSDVLNKEEYIVSPNEKTVLDHSATMQSTEFQLGLPNTEVVSIQIESVEIHSLEQRAMNNAADEDDNSTSTDYDIEVVESRQSDRENLHIESSNEDDFKNTFVISLEKAWGSLGITLKGDEEEVLVSGVLAGGSADLSGLVHEGS